MTEDTKVHPADPAPANAVWKKTGQWKKWLGIAGILLGIIFVAGMVGTTYFLTETDNKIKDVGMS